MTRRSGFGHKTLGSLGVKRSHRSSTEQERILRRRAIRSQTTTPDERLEEFMLQQRKRIQRLHISGYRDRTTYFEEEPSIRWQIASGQLDMESR